MSVHAVLREGVCEASKRIMLFLMDVYPIMKSKKIAALVLSLVSVHCLAESINIPKFNAGDTWVYQDTHEKSPNIWTQTKDEITVTRVSPSSILVATKPSGSNQAPREIMTAKDWSSSRSVDDIESVVYKPLSFPLSIGKSWDLKYTLPHPVPAIKYSKYDIKYTVGDVEAVDVPGGKFKAIKIEGEGRWSDELEPGQIVAQSAQTTANGTSMATETRKIPELRRTGKIYQAYWYAPEIKRWVKSIEEGYAPDGTRAERRTMELVSFHAGE